jgi:hypothetical protein
MAAAPLTLESHGVSLSLAGTPDIDGFVAAANARARIKGLDDALNPGILDAAKLRAMVTAIPGQPRAVRDALDGHALIVATDGFGVLAVEPTAAGAFGPAYRITIERLAGNHVLAHADPAMDAGLARTRSAAAEAATTAAHKSVLAAEAGRPDPDGLDTGSVRWRRSQAARAWQIAARAWQRAAPSDPAAARAAAAAGEAAKAYRMPSGGNV